MDINPNTFFTCQLTADTNQSLSQGIWVTYSITNTSAEHLSLLPWNTPLEGFMSKLFIITDEQNNQLSYQGPMVKRPLPSDQDYLMIPSGETVTSKLDLQQVYEIRPAQYLVSMNTKYVQVKINKQSYTIQICKDAKLTINITE